METRKNKLIISVLTLGLSLSIVACSKDIKANNIVRLESQKESIDESLLVKSLENIKDFKAERWLEDGKIIGIKDQPINDESNKAAKISIYNSLDKTFEDLVIGKGKEWLFIEDISLDGNELLYSALVDGDFKSNLYDLYSINLKTKETKKIISNTSTTSGIEDNYIYISQGLRLFRYDFGGDLKEIELPKNFSEELDNFSEFEFEDYLNKYYKNEVVEGKRRDIIKADYEYAKKNNSLIRVSVNKDELIMNSENGKLYIYNLESKTYKIDNDYRIENFYNMDQENNGIIEKEFLDKGKVNLWKLDEDGNRKFKIEELSGYINVKLSPDKNKVMYNYEDNNYKKASYVFDLRTEEKIILYPEVIGSIVWNQNSKELFITGRNLINNGSLQEVTSFIELN